VKKAEKLCKWHKANPKREHKRLVRRARRRAERRDVADAPKRLAGYVRGWY
jgi:hypothetical protein